MNLFLTNSFSQQIEKFIPTNLKGVSMYVCGPTVYDRPHLGNVRSAVVYDVLFRILRYLYPKVIYVRNITDIDDKIITTAKRQNLSIQDLTNRMTKLYHQDVEALNCLPPTIEPKASEHIKDMISMIQDLINLDYAYVEEGHVLFDTTKYPDYGKLSKRNLDDLIAGSRVEVAPIKKHPTDFVLWKPTKTGEECCFFASPWGNGRPGWHIECSAMSKVHLSENFDIHGGGVDLLFPHHENELAQSKCANPDSNFAHFWVHNGFLTINGEKMSKSSGNFTTAHEVLEAGLPGSVLRYFYLTTHYRKPLDFNKKSIDDSYKAVERFTEALNVNGMQDPRETQQHDKKIDEDFLMALLNDMNTPSALAYLHTLADKGLRQDSERATQLILCSRFLGLDLFAFTRKTAFIPQNIVDLAELRQKAKEERNWEQADVLRDTIEKMGYLVQDKPGTFVLKKLPPQII